MLNLFETNIFLWLPNDWGSMLTGSIVKILYAFLWQEDALDVNLPTFIGPRFATIINMIGSIFNGLEDKNVARGKDLYPGHEECNVLSKHAFWHQQAGTQGTLF